MTPFGTSRPCKFYKASSVHGIADPLLSRTCVPPPLPPSSRHTPLTVQILPTSTRIPLAAAGNVGRLRLLARSYQSDIAHGTGACPCSGRLDRSSLICRSVLSPGCWPSIGGCFDYFIVPASAAAGKQVCTTPLGKLERRASLLIPSLYLASAFPLHKDARATYVYPNRGDI
ncbi:hypothetical protein BC834DRAFT_853329 [Gloeopeniophorella convolvens]|nr:hypothetical protein BC834DRAFT_853329 [Gloeopeniophorella convolvens]